MDRVFQFARASSMSLASIVLAPRWGGLVVLDRFGLALRPGRTERPHVPETAVTLAFQTVSLRAAKTPEHRRRAVRRIVGRIVRGHRPALLVVGRIGREGPIHRELRTHAVQAADLHEIQAEVRSVPDAKASLLGPGMHPEGALAAVLTRTVCQVLDALRTARGDVRRYRAHAWSALAIAVTAYAEYCPWSLQALADVSSIPIGLADALRRSLAHSSYPLP